MTRALIFALCLVACATLHAQTQNTFIGSGTGAIPDGSGDPPPAPGGDLLVTFNVSGITDPVIGVGVNVTIAHAYLGDVRCGLAAPGLVASTPIFGRVGATTTDGYGSDAFLNGTYYFGDGGTADFWDTAANNSGNVMPSGAGLFYRASTEGGSATGGTIVNITSAFSGLSNAQINGQWTLVIDDVTQSDTGSVSGAQLFIITDDNDGGGGGGGDDGDDDGCSTGGTAGLSLLGLLAALSMLGLCCRLRSA